MTDLYCEHVKQRANAQDGCSVRLDGYGAPPGGNGVRTNLESGTTIGGRTLAVKFQNGQCSTPFGITDYSTQCRRLKVCRSVQGFQSAPLTGVRGDQKKLHQMVLFPKFQSAPLTGVRGGQFFDQTLPGRVHKGVLTPSLTPFRNAEAYPSAFSTGSLRSRSFGRWCMNRCKRAR